MEQSYTRPIRANASWPYHDGQRDQCGNLNACKNVLFLVLAMLVAPIGAAQAGSVVRPAQQPDGGNCVIFRDGFDAYGIPLLALGFGEPIVHVTRGGYTVSISTHTIVVSDFIGMNKVEHWGDPHENLNGKHIKDWGGEPQWDGGRRSLVLADGTRITMEASGAQGVVLHTSIYDGDENLQIDNSSNMIVHHGFDAEDTQQREAAQYDGETALFETDESLGVATYTNVYNEDAGFNRIDFLVPLGGTGGCENPNQVHDYYDDPRLGHT